MATNFIPTVSIPEAAQVHEDGYRADTLYSHRTHLVIPEVLPTRDKAADVIADYAPKIHKRTTVEQLRSEIAWLKMCYEVDTITAVSLMVAAAREAGREGGHIAPSRVNRVFRRVELAAQAHGVRMIW